MQAGHAISSCSAARACERVQYARMMDRPRAPFRLMQPVGGFSISSDGTSLPFQQLLLSCVARSSPRAKNEGRPMNASLQHGR